MSCPECKKTAAKLRKYKKRLIELKQDFISKYDGDESRWYACLWYGFIDSLNEFEALFKEPKRREKKNKAAT